MAGLADGSLLLGEAPRRTAASCCWENFAALTLDGCDLVFVRDFSALYRVSLRAALGTDQSP